MIGKKFGKLTVIEECEERDNHNKIMYTCKCDCGKITIVNGNNLRVGNTKSCGCLNHEANNCRWVDITTQIRNRRNTLYITCNGETKPLMEWCEILNLNYSTLKGGYYKGVKDLLGGVR